MTETVKQQTDSDCFLACAAMAAGVSYDEAAECVPVDLLRKIQRHGTYDQDVQRLFSAIGLESESLSNVKTRVSDYPGYGVVTFLMLLLWGRRACIQVPSKNRSGWMHVVYWSGEELHDPSTKETYTLPEIVPINVWVFKEPPDA